jgi:four helix bundle protein
MSVRSYRDLKVWQASMELVDQVYDVVDAFPAKQQFVLSAQVLRSASSVPSNIAEGHAQASTKAFLRHLSITAGSLAECETQLAIAARRRYLSDETLEILMRRTDEISRMLTGLRKSLKRRLDNPRR